MPYTRYNPELWWQVPSGEVSEVCGQLKETLVTSSSSSSSQTKRGDNKAAFTLQQDIGTMLYDGESSYVLLPTAGYNAMRHVASNCDCSTSSLHITYNTNVDREHVLVSWSWCGEPVVYLLVSRGCLRYIEVNKLTEIEFHPEDASRASPAPSSSAPRPPLRRHHCTSYNTQY